MCCLARVSDALSGLNKLNFMLQQALCMNLKPIKSLKALPSTMIGPLPRHKHKISKVLFFNPFFRLFYLKEKVKT